MKKFLISLAVVASVMTMVATEAEARRMGGGGSFGRQSQSMSRPAPTQSSQATNTAKQAAPAAAPGAAAAKPASPWKGILGGALVGLGLGALMSSMGMGGAMGSILMIALLAFAGIFIFRMLRSKAAASNAQPSYAGGYPASNTPDIGSRVEPIAFQGAASMGSIEDVTPVVLPADFDVPSFLRNAKTYFIRLQAAWDKADINDLGEFTSPEMYGELKLQIQERGATANVTDVVTLDAELLGLETLGSEYLASVKFSGMIKESAGAPAEAFAEVWNMAKPTSGQGGWVLAGIQQLS